MIVSAHRANRLEQARLDALEGRDQPSEVHPYKGPQSAEAFAEVLENPTGNEPADPSAPRPRRGPPRAEIQNTAARGPSALEDLSAEAMRLKLGARRHAASVRAALRAWHLFASTVLMYPVDSTLPPQTGAHGEASSRPCSVQVAGKWALVQTTAGTHQPSGAPFRACA